MDASQVEHIQREIDEYGFSHGDDEPLKAAVKIAKELQGALDDARKRGMSYQEVEALKEDGLIDVELTYSQKLIEEAAKAQKEYAEGKERILRKEETDLPRRQYRFERLKTEINGMDPVELLKRARSYTKDQVSMNADEINLISSRLQSLRDSKETVLIADDESRPILAKGASRRGMPTERLGEAAATTFENMRRKALETHVLEPWLRDDKVRDAEHRLTYYTIPQGKIRHRFTEKWWAKGGYREYDIKYLVI